MTRWVVINTDSTGKQRNQTMRTVAEILRRLSQKQVVDDEVRNMMAMLVYCFREIEAGIEQSATAWEKRDYWVKSEELRQRWMWVGDMADQLRSMIYSEQWTLLPTDDAQVTAARSRHQNHQNDARCHVMGRRLRQANAGKA